ncbi:uncharacterized protein Ir67a [Drosophila kikkawai]|uniref:Uncharacterized protein Ir67a n=1 Tax=Drosophila kikkawai TaxID=30033 RepID=A0A6P4J0D5_DROKI|nr:uncharacterized protein LOC108078584 [Drosophila kikkawai]
MWPLLVPVLLLANETSSWLQPILDSIYRDKPYETILLLRHSRDLRNDISGLEGISLPILNFNEQMDFPLRSTYNKEMVALIWQTGNPKFDSDLWQALDRNLLNMRKVRLLLCRRWEEKPTDEFADTTENLRFLDVAVIGQENRIYHLQPYAPKRWLEVNPTKETIFTPIRNYRGKYILTIPDQFSPRSIVSRNPETGKLEMTGYVYKLILEFTRIYNFTFRWVKDIVPGEQLNLFLLRNMTLNGTIDMPISLCGFEMPSELGVFSSIYDLGLWLVMVPCAQDIRTADVYVVMVSGQFLLVLLIFYYIFTFLDLCFGTLLLRKRVDWSSFVLNERMISGIIGQSFNMRARNTLSSRVTNASLFLLGLVLSTLYAAHLKTLLTKRPKARQISNFQELRDSPVSVYFDEAERFYLTSFDWERPVTAIRDKIQFVNTRDFHDIRSSLNRSQSFSVLDTEWLIMAKRQEFFEQPVYCFLPEMAIIRASVLLSLPMQANSIYEYPMNELIHRAQDAGLLDFWKQETLRKMISLGMISQKNPFPYVAFREFKVADLTWIWLLLFSLLALAFFVFLCEHLVYWFTGRGH